jgi:hypothetical protein
MKTRRVVATIEYDVSWHECIHSEKQISRRLRKIIEDVPHGSRGGFHLDVLYKKTVAASFKEPTK